MKKTEKLQGVYNLSSMNSSNERGKGKSKGYVVGEVGNGRVQSSDWQEMELEGGAVIEFRIRGGKGHTVGTGGDGRHVVTGGKGHIVGGGGNG